MTDMDMPLPEPVAHMYPSDLERFQTNETFATAYSVAVGNPDERSVPLLTLSDCVAYAAAEVEKERERIAALERLVIDAAYTLDKARIWSGMGWTYNPLHPVHYAPMRERLHNECNNIEAIRAAAIRAGSAKS